MARHRGAISLWLLSLWARKEKVARAPAGARNLFDTCESTEAKAPSPQPSPPTMKLLGERENVRRCAADSGSPATYSMPQHRHRDPALMRVAAVLPQEQPLPGAQLRLAAVHRHHEAHAGEHGAHVGGHVVGAFGVVLEDR